MTEEMFARGCPNLHMLALENGMTFLDTEFLEAWVDGRYVWSFASVFSAEMYVRGFLKGRGVL